jgi:ATP-dependent Lhr-like helicase
MEIPFHPLVKRWFTDRFTRPSPPQEAGWTHIAQGRSTLIAAPTGSGKTLAAFLWSIDRLIQRAVTGQLDDTTTVVYVSPLKALGNDIAKNLQTPLTEIYDLAGVEGVLLPTIRVAVRSGDTPAPERQLMVRRPPHILITTPESLYILLTAERSRSFLRTAETVIVDEIHAVAADKRGAHLALSLERLEVLAGRPLQRIGLSATQKPIEEIARLLVGGRHLHPDGTPNCAIVDVGHKRDLNLSIELPDQELGPIVTQGIWSGVFDKIVGQVKAHRTTLVFVNTRRLVERVAHQLTERLGEGKVGAHHGSLSRKSRLEVEEKLKSGALPVVVATASLELGIDIGHVDVVCHIGSSRTLSILLQRVGRSGHWLGATPKGIFYPLTRDALVECVAAIRAVRDGQLDEIHLTEKPLDVLAQQIVATVASVTSLRAEAGAHASSGISEDGLWALVRQAYPYRDLSRTEYEQLLEMLSEGVVTRRNRRSAYLHRDRIHGMLRARRGARLAAITNGGAIPDTADYDVIEFPDETFVGKVNEDFAIESLAGDIFLLGNRSWRIRRVGSGKVWVEDARGLPPTIPFWLGEAPARTRELSAAVSDLRRDVAGRSPSEAKRWLMEDVRLVESGADQIVDYVNESQALLGRVPTRNQIIAERFFDEAGGMQLVIHSPWGGRINRAWGMALRKRFCVSFDRELQAAATDDGIVISLVEQHSFPLTDVFRMLHPAMLDKALTEAILASPIFDNRWRWNVTRALAVMRSSGGRKVPVALQRMRAEDLLAAVFPEQVMCQDNRTGPGVIPDHPLVNETLRDCLYEAMDIGGLKQILARLNTGEIETFTVDTPAPSPMAHEILNANPYAFLDDAPLEERRARAVSLRRVDPSLGQLGRLDGAAIDEVRRQAWPEMRNADEVHDFLLGVYLLPVTEREDWAPLAKKLIAAGRATVLLWHAPMDSQLRRAYVTAERWDGIRCVIPDGTADPPFAVPLTFGAETFSKDEVMRKLVAGWLEVIGPTTVSQLSQKLGFSAGEIESALLALEAAGVVLRGEFTGRPNGELEWCDRVLLARIHRLTIGRLRREIEPVSPAQFMKFLFRWQHVTPESHLRGRDGVLEVIRQLQGMELPAPAWEQQVLSSRIQGYNPSDLEHLCLAGVVSWGRLRVETESPAEGETGQTQPLRRRRRRRLPTRNAPIGFLLREEMDYFLVPGAVPYDRLAAVSSMAREVGHYLNTHGASFLTDIARGTGLLKVQAEEALWQLVAHGFATGDGIAGLRVLLTPETKRRRARRGLRLISGGRAADRMMPVGRWALWRDSAAGPLPESEKVNERWALQLLQRYGVIFRELLARESCAPSWRGLLYVLRRLEARGEIRGGRFVNGFVGEQFALPEAVEVLRADRRSQQSQAPVMISCADPLNLLGILNPGPRVSPYSNQMIVYQDGVPVDVGALGAVVSRTRQAETKVVE